VTFKAAMASATGRPLTTVAPCFFSSEMSLPSIQLAFSAFASKTGSSGRTAIVSRVAASAEELKQERRATRRAGRMACLCHD